MDEKTLLKRLIKDMIDKIDNLSTLEYLFGFIHQRFIRE